MIIQKYDESWPHKFEALREVLSSSLSRFLAIEHVGSTSIEGMEAKPIIDIDIVIESREDFPQIKRELESVGYVHVGDLGTPGREAFKRDGKKNIQPLDDIEHHLYVCTKNNEELKRHLYFRDMLRKYENLRKEYCEIKHEILFKVSENNREGYVEMKEKEYGWFFTKVSEMK